MSFPTQAPITDDYIDAGIPGCERSVLPERRDTIGIPPGVSRGLRNVGSEPAWLMGMARGADPGMINGPEPVRVAATAAGVKLP